MSSDGRMGWGRGGRVLLPGEDQLRANLKAGHFRERRSERGLGVSKPLLGVTSVSSQWADANVLFHWRSLTRTRWSLPEAVRLVMSQENDIRYESSCRPARPH